MLKIIIHLFDVLYQKTSEMWTEFNPIHHSTKLTLLMFIAITTFSVRKLKQAYMVLGMQRVNTLFTLVPAWLITSVMLNTQYAFAPNVFTAIGFPVSFILAVLFSVNVLVEEYKTRQKTTEDHEVKMPDPRVEV